MRKGKIKASIADKFTAQQLDFLQTRNFPIELGWDKVLQRRTIKQKAGKHYFKAPEAMINFESLVYNQVSQNVYKILMKKEEEKKKQLGSQYEEKKELIEQGNSHLLDYLCTKDPQKELEEEARRILSKWGNFAPEPTPNMVEEVEDVEEVEEVVKIKNLSPTQKTKVNDLANSGYSADEIAEALDLGVERIVNYLNK